MWRGGGRVSQSGSRAAAAPGRCPTQIICICILTMVLTSLPLKPCNRPKYCRVSKMVNSLQIRNCQKVVVLSASPVECNLLWHITQVMTRSRILAQHLKKLNNTLKAHTDLFHLHKTAVELPSPNNNREQAGLAAATCSKKPVDLTSLSLKNILKKKQGCDFFCSL